MMFVRALVIAQVCCFAGCFRVSFGSANPGADGFRDESVVVDVSEPVDASERVERSGRVGASEPDATPVNAPPREASTSTWQPRPLWILADELDNARDLGGVPLSKGAAVERGVLFRGPPLAPLTAAGCAELEKLGIRTVVDLRIESERVTKPEADCVSRAAAIVLAPLPVPYNVSPSDYIADLNATDSIASVFATLGDADAYPVYMHCTWGRDRTGVLVAVILRALGASRADILKEYVLSSETVGAYPTSLEAVLDAIEAHGGIEAYLKAAGVSGEQLATLRARAVRSVEHPSQD